MSLPNSLGAIIALLVLVAVVVLLIMGGLTMQLVGIFICCLALSRLT